MKKPLEETLKTEPFSSTEEEEQELKEAVEILIRELKKYASKYILPNLN